MGQLDDKVAIVTGAATGIGEAAALALVNAGARVAISDINDEDGEAKAKEFRDRGGEAFYQHADVCLSTDIERLVEATVARYGKLDVLVNNAAVAISGTAVDISEEDWNRVLNTNLTSVWRGMKYAIPHMLKNGTGSIINVSSAQGLMGFKGWSAYAAAKGGINALTRQAAVEYSPENIRINAIAPGTIMTPMNERIFSEAEDPAALIQHWTSRHALGRFGQPEEVGNLIVFLASDDSSFITGDIIRVDGGLVINGG
ncbi:MAG: SDR family oxidoreductase [Anaerolineae bacterium]|jgi:NAD(P)-dependent dehydrogenase (short-subunit alcohol dehydrogenase family)|nr:SDR family oxidoreductase [Anaerolineae bacterium]